MKSILLALIFGCFATTAIAQQTSKNIKASTAKEAARTKTTESNKKVKAGNPATKQVDSTKTAKQISFAEMLRMADSSAASKPDSVEVPKQN